MYDHYNQILQSLNVTHNDFILIVGGVLIFLQIMMLSGFCTRKEKKKEKSAAKK